MGVNLNIEAAIRFADLDQRRKGLEDDIEHVKEQAPAVLTSANECLTHKSHYTTQARESS